MSYEPALVLSMYILYDSMGVEASIAGRLQLLFHDFGGQGLPLDLELA